MSIIDFKIEVKVRGILTRFEIDMRYVDVDVIRQVVYINGYMVYDRSAQPVLNRDISIILHEIKKWQGVKDVVIQLQEPPAVKKKQEKELPKPFIKKTEGKTEEKTETTEETLR